MFNNNNNNNDNNNRANIPDSGTHQASYPVGNEVSLPGVKLPGHEADHSTPTIAVVKKTWIYTSTPPYVFMA
jgi:hypothetical protein